MKDFVFKRIFNYFMLNPFKQLQIFDAFSLNSFS